MSLPFIKSFRSRSFRSELTLVLVALVLLLTATLGWLAYHSSRRIIEHNAIRAVGISANAREQTLLRVLRRDKDRAAGFLKTTVLICKNRIGKEACLLRELDQFLSTEGAVSARLVVHGIAPILFEKESFSTEDLEAPPGRLEVFARDRRGRPYYTVRAESENGAASVLLRFDMSGINAIFLDRDILGEYGLGGSGETFLIDSKGFLMTPSRYPGSSDKNRLIESRAVQACLAGADGESLGRDDLGVEVIHGFRYVEEIGACIIARREASEAFAPAIQLRKKVIGISGLFAALAIALSFGLARKFSRPIDLLTEHARRLQKGDFEGAAPIEGPSEVRTFAETFAAMTRSLKESRAALIRSEGRVRAVLENTLDAVVGIDGRGIIIDWNVRAEAIFGWNRDEAVGRRLSETIIPEKYREAHERGLALFSETGEGPILNRRIELSALRRDGEEFPVDLTVTPVQNEEETIFYAFIRDIAERKRAEGKIKFQANLLEVVGQAVIATDLNGSIIFWNRFAEKLYGWPASEAAGRDVLELVPAHSRAEAAEIISRLMEGKSWSGEFPVRRRDGTVFTAMVTDTPIHDEQGRLIGMIGVSSDITERKEAEEALRKAKEALEEKMGQLQKRLAVSQTLHWISTQFARGGEIDLFLGKIVKEVAELTETAKCSIGLIDPEGKKITPQAYYGFKEERIRRVEVPMPRNENDLLFRALHRGETVMLNRILSDPRAERYREIVEMLEIQSALVTPLQVRGKSIGVVGVYDKFHGKPFSPDDLQLLQTIANQIAGAISIGRYYEDLQKIIQELRRKTIEAEEASRLKSQFLSNVSHEFRTPLNAIIGYTSLLLDKRYGPVGESQAVPLEGILRNADDLLKLVNDVLDLSRIEAGKTAIDLSSVEMPSLIEDVLDKMKPLIEKRPLSIQWRKINEIPKIESDPLKIRQIVVNLLSNAIKFTPQGMITVEAEDLPEREGIEVRVQDTGIGIKPEETSKIFEAFHQIDGSMTREYGGVGLGLAIVKNMVDLLKGEIHVRSEYGKGSRFTLFLPYRLQV